jgi:nitroreductase
MLKNLIIQNRSYRRFYEDQRIPRETLTRLIDLARLSASGGNTQPLKFIIAEDTERCALIFPHLRWARHLAPWTAPELGERPAAYILVLGDQTVSKSYGVDHGIASQSILLGATEAGYGGCMVGSIAREELRSELQIPDHYELLLVIALGKPKESVMIEPLSKEGSTIYWRDANGVHHVPKRALEELIVG